MSKRTKRESVSRHSAGSVARTSVIPATQAGPHLRSVDPRGCIEGVSVIIPTYQEAENIPRTLPLVAAAARRLGVAFEVVVVDDASSDGTANVAEQVALSGRIPLQVVRRSGPRCLARAVLDGARVARYSLVCVMDADLSHDPDALWDIVAPVRSREVHVCIGSRYAAGSEVGAWSFGRVWFSKLGTVVVRRLVKTSDPLSGYFCCERRFLDGSSLRLRPSGFKILLEVLVRGGDSLRTRDVPIRFRDRQTGASKFGVRVAVDFAWQCLRLGAGRLWGQRFCVSKRGVSLVEAPLSLTTDS